MARKSFKAEAKDRVDDLQGVFSELQNARRECRNSDLAILEEQLHLMLREWKSELHNPSSSSAASSLVATPSSSELSSDMKRLLQLTEEDDDASSSLTACLTKPMLGSHQNQLSYCSTEELYTVNSMHIHEQTPEEEVVERLLRSETMAESSPHCDESLDAQLRMPSFSLQEPFVPKVLFSGIGYAQDEIHMSLPKMSFSSPSAFLGPKCALWDCPRPANGLDWYQDYCSAFHASLAISEGVIAKTPVVRPGGINLKDGPLFSALSAKSQHKLVGIPECEGAATSKSPWNAHDLFDISVLYGKAIREWLFFDKPRRAFESGTRKQRSLPDYNGRGWHESRKQIIKELGGLKRSYYMDPQPDSQFEWHLYEYEIMDYDACALYRLELKQVNINKKGSKQRLHNEQVRALENEIGRLPSDLSLYGKKMPSAPEEVKRTSRRRDKINYGNKGNSVTMESPILIQNIKSLDFSLEDVSNYLATP